MKKTGFTLVELLIVIAAIAIIAGLIFAVFSGIERKSILQKAESERVFLETAIESYHSKYGVYPPSGINSTVNPLYYELTGTTVSNSTPASFTTLDNSTTISGTLISSTFGFNGFINCSKGSGDDSANARDFISDIKSRQIATNSEGIFFIVTGASGDLTYMPLPGVYAQDGRPADPWLYLYPGINNPKGYDLSLEIVVAGKTNLICNWRD